jgi:hypothetical protein
LGLDGLVEGRAVEGKTVEGTAVEGKAAGETLVEGVPAISAS